LDNIAHYKENFLQCIRTLHSGRSIQMDKRSHKSHSCPDCSGGWCRFHCSRSSRTRNIAHYKEGSQLQRIRTVRSSRSVQSDNIAHYKQGSQLQCTRKLRSGRSIQSDSIVHYKEVSLQCIRTLRSGRSIQMDKRSHKSHSCPDYSGGWCRFHCSRSSRTRNIARYKEGSQLRCIRTLRSGRSIQLDKYFRMSRS